MQEADVVGDLLFPADQKTSRPIEPRKSALDFPAARFATSTFGFWLLPFLGGKVRGVTPAANQALNGLAHIAFVETEMLRFLLSGTWAMDGNTVDGFFNEFLIMHI